MGGQVGEERVWRPGWACPVATVLRQQRHGAGDPTYAITSDGAHWRTFRTPLGPATVRVRARPAAGEVVARAWGDGAAWLLDALPGLLGADDDVAGFVPHHPQVAEAWRRFGAWRLGRSGLVMDALVPAVIEQKVTGQEAFRGYAALVRRHGEPAPGPTDGPRLHVAPTAAAVAAVPSWEWLALHIDPARSRTLVTAARVADGLERSTGLPSEEVDRRLRSVRGIGVWTSAEVRRRAHGDADAVSFGDYHVAKDVGWALTGTPVDDDGMAELLEPYRPHRGRVPELLAMAGLHRPRHGARMAPRTHLPATGRAWRRPAP